MNKKILKVIFSSLLFSFALSNCGSVTNHTQERLKEIYYLATKQGFQGSYEEWLLTIKGETGDDGNIPTIEIGDNGNFIINGVDTGVYSKGDKGEVGPQANAIVSIEKTSTKGNIDVYTITYCDGSIFNFEVTNGKDGIDGKPGLPGINGAEGEPGKDGKVPEITIGENGNWFIDGVDTLINSGYGQSEKITLRLDLNGGNLKNYSLEYKLNKGDKLPRLPTPTKKGYYFFEWVTDFSINGKSAYEIDCVYGDLTLYAKYEKQVEHITYVIEGNFNYDTYVSYGEKYKLAIPYENKIPYKDFLAWSINGVEIPNEGIWTYDTYVVEALYKEKDYKIYCWPPNNTKPSIVLHAKFGDTINLPFIYENNKRLKGWHPLFPNTDVTVSDGFQVTINFPYNAIFCPNFVTEPTIDFDLTLKHVDGNAKYFFKDVPVSIAKKGFKVEPHNDFKNDFVCYTYNKSVVSDDKGYIDEKNMELILKENIKTIPLEIKTAKDISKGNLDSNVIKATDKEIVPAFKHSN